MDAIILQLQDGFEGTIDFEGQRLSELICTWLLSITAVIAIAVGFIQQDIFLTLWTGLGGTMLAMLAVVPAWPGFNKHPQKWFSPNPNSGLPTGGIIVDARKIG